MEILLLVLCRQNFKIPLIKATTVKLGEKKNDVAGKLKAKLLTPLKLKVDKVSNNFYTAVLKFPLIKKLINEGNFCKLLRLKAVWTQYLWLI